MVLIIEDDEDTRVAYQEFLEIAGFRVTSVSTGSDALDALRADDIRAVLLDLGLPDIDGRVLNDALRAAAAPRPLSVMAMTGHDLREDERAKFTAVMRKPVDLDAVAAWLREVATESTAPRAAR